MIEPTDSNAAVLLNTIDPCCADCIFCEKYFVHGRLGKTLEDVEFTGGKCRRDAPIRDEDGAAVWPRVGADDWCGHYYPVDDFG